MNVLIWFRLRVIRATFVMSLAFAVVGVLTLDSSPAFAASKTEKKLTKALDSAVEDYDMLEIESAEKKLKDGIALAKKKDTTGPVLAKLYMMLGVVQFAATRDEAATEKAFVDGLTQDPNAVVEPVYSTPELEKIYKAAKGQIAPAAGASELQHEQISTADAGQPMTVMVAVPASMPVYKIFVLYRQYDAETFERVELKPTGNTAFAADIPGAQVRSSQIDYFIIAEDRAGSIIGQIGSDEQPLNVVVLGSSDLPDKKPEDDEPTPDSEKHQWVYVSLYGGTGLGILFGGTPTANPGQEVNPGFAPAFGHALLDVGVRITDSAHLGIFFRLQFAPSQDFTNIEIDESGFPTTEEECLGLGLPGDCILGLKYKWVFLDNTDLKFYSSVGTGVGRVRNWLRLKQHADNEACQGKEIFSDPGGDFCYTRDTVRTGWAHAGVGGGMLYAITDFMDLSADTYLMFLFPDTSVNLDINLGFSFRF